MLIVDPIVEYDKRGWVMHQFPIALQVFTASGDYELRFRELSADFWGSANQILQPLVFPDATKKQNGLGLVADRLERIEFAECYVRNDMNLCWRKTDLLNDRVDHAAAVNDDMIAFACRIQPKMVTLVPEKRNEITTEGGLNCCVSKVALKKISSAISKLQKKNIHVSVFVGPDLKQIQAVKNLNANAVEIHTGQYCHTIEKLCHKKKSPLSYAQALAHTSVLDQIAQIDRACELAQCLDLHVYAGHGLHAHNLKPIVNLKQIEEYNIGHAIIGRAIFVGLNQAIQEIQNILKS